MSNWLFHGNPKRFPMLDHLHNGESDIDWLITQHLDDVSIGDNAALWVSGRPPVCTPSGASVGHPSLDRRMTTGSNPTIEECRATSARCTGPTTSWIGLS